MRFFVVLVVESTTALHDLYVDNHTSNWGGSYCLAPAKPDFCAETTGFEPATYGLTGRYANRYTTSPVGFLLRPLVTPETETPQMLVWQPDPRGFGNATREKTHNPYSSLPVRRRPARPWVCNGHCALLQRQAGTVYALVRSARHSRAGRGYTATGARLLRTRRTTSIATR